jgi:hypothetical protein
MSSVTFPGNTAGFGSTRGLAQAGQVVLAANGIAVNVTLSALGRVRICSAADIGYAAC